MRRFKNIVVLVGGSTTGRVLDRAVALAQRNEASVTLLDVQESVPARNRRRPLDDGSVVDLDSVILASRVEEMQAIAGDHSDVELDAVTTEVPVFVEVIERVIRDGFDLVVVPEDLDGGETGAAVSHLFRKCPVPVMMLKTEASPDVAVAVGPFEDESRSMLDETLIEMSSSLAEMRGGSLHVLHAWRLVGESLLRSSARRGPSAAMVDELVEETRRQAEADVTRLLDNARLAGVPVATHVVQGVAGDVIPSLVARERAGILVMGSLARTGIAGLLIGNTAERVLSTVEASVLAVKPPGFESPIRP
jgi:nucleotide-binding universal stress UspA family protein